MIHPYFLVFELSIYSLFAACLWHASRQGRYRVLELIFAGLYGFLLEWLTIKQLRAYHYGDFLIAIDGAPLNIALAWAAIIYSAMEFSDRIQLPEAVRPVLDALLALNIDLALDVVAIRLGMWTWTTLALDQQWFGVPWGNFWAWFIVVWAYSGFIRALRVWRDRPVRRWLYVPLATALALVVLLLTNQLYRSLIIRFADGSMGPLALVAVGLLVIVESRPRVLRPGPPDPVVIAVPLVTHALSIGGGVFYGFYAQQPILAVIAVAMLAVGVAVHLWPWLAARTRPTPIPS
jgi:hypothetical protein